MRQRVFYVLMLSGVAISLCSAASKDSDAPQNKPYLFCVDNYGAIYVHPGPKDATLKLLDAPEGMELLQPGGVLLWAPTEKQLGEHTVRLSVTPPEGKTGEASERLVRIQVQPVRRALFVFAHPDDEFGIMAKMKRLADRGVDLWAVWTCGGNKVRDTEAAAAMTKLGLKKDHLIFQNYGNFTTPKGLQKKIAPLAKLLQTRPFDQIYTNAYEGGHSQHDMANFIAVQAARQAGFRGQIYEHPLYNMYGGKLGMFTFIPATMPAVEMSLRQAELDFIVSLVPCYKSQKMITQGFLVGLSQQQKTHPRYRPRPNWDYTRQPHPGLLMLEMRIHEKNPSFAKRVGGPAGAYYRSHPRRTEGVWEQDRTAAEKQLSQKVFADPYRAKTTPAVNPASLPATNRAADEGR